jgi:MFS family permease
LATSTEAYLSAIVIGSVRLVSSLLLSNLLTRFRRRPIYFASMAISALALAAFAACSAAAVAHTTDVVNVTHVYNGSLASLNGSSEWTEPAAGTSLRWTSLFFACVLVFGAHMGVQSLPTLLAGELFPSEARAVCKAASRSIASVMLIVGLKARAPFSRQ